MYQIILIGILFLITIYLLYQNYTIQKEIFKIKNSFDELNNFLDLSIKKTKPKVLDTLSEINTTSITDNIITYSNDVRRVKEDSSNTSDNNQKLINNIMNKLDKNNNDIDLKNEVDDCETDDECDDDCEDDSEIVDSEIDNTSTIEDECEDLEKIEFFNKEDNNLTSVIENIKSSISNSLNNEQISVKSDDLNQPIDQSADQQIEIPKNQLEDQPIKQLEDQPIKQLEDQPIKQLEDQPIKQLEDQQINQPVDQPINENINIRETYTVDDLKKMTIINIKDIARKFKIILSISGKSKTKDQLIQNIIELNN
jgi:hypothetical protein